MIACTARCQQPTLFVWCTLQHQTLLPSPGTPIVYGRNHRILRTPCVRLDAGTAPSVLILAPTRELAMQIAGVLEAAGAPLGLTTLCAYGGVPKPPQASISGPWHFLLVRSAAGAPNDAMLAG